MRLALLLPFLTGCFLFSKGPSSQTGETEEKYRTAREHVPPTYDLWPYGEIAKFQPGEWARYRITGKEGASELTIAAISRDGATLWVEVIEEGEERRASLQKVSADGVVVEAWYRIVPKNGAAGPVMKQPVEQRSTPPGPRFTERSRTAEKKTVKVGARELAVTEVRVESEDIIGRVLIEEHAWSPEAPSLIAASEEGGLVRRKTESGTVELLEFGTGHKPLVEVPK